MEVLRRSKRVEGVADDELVDAVQLRVAGDHADSGAAQKLTDPAGEAVDDGFLPQLPSGHVDVRSIDV